MKLSKKTLINLRSALIFLLNAVEDALLEGWGWTPRGSSAPVDGSGILERT